MMNQVSAEALYSATYVENYLDCVENLPNDLQRLISRNRELDVNYLANIRTAEIQKDVLMTTPASNTSRISRAHYKMQQALIAAQEIGDEKMNLVQTILATIESKTKILDQNHRTLDVRRDDNSLNESREPQASGSNTTNTAPPSGERTTKRARRSRQETSGAAATTNDNAVAEHVLRSQASSSNAASTSTGTRRTNNKAGNKKGKKKTTKSNTAQRNEETSPKAEDRIDPDEPTYCLCDQISYGEMIMCDNDLCPIEWFHFSCVSLVTKPKGRWFCPKCRGERPSVMKPKHVFLKELQIYNKEKEEKTY